MEPRERGENVSLTYMHGSSQLQSGITTLSRPRPRVAVLRGDASVADLSSMNQLLVTSLDGQHEAWKPLSNTWSAITYRAVMIIAQRSPGLLRELPRITQCSLPYCL